MEFVLDVFVIKVLRANSWKNSVKETHNNSVRVIHTIADRYIVKQLAFSKCVALKTVSLMTHGLEYEKN